MSFQGKFKPFSELFTGTKVLGDEYTCANARFVRMVANTASRTIEVRRGPNDADADTLVGQFILKGNGDSCIIEKHPTDVLVFNTCSASKVSNIA